MCAVDEPLPPEERARIACNVVDAVRQLHGLGLIANDLKPVRITGLYVRVGTAI